MPTASAVREMFDSVAHRYDAANTALSFGVHHIWRRALGQAVPVGPNQVALDLCTGTGDLLPVLAQRCSRVVGADFSSEMLTQARARFGDRFELVEADALNLPFATGSFDVVSVAFGVRNFENLERGLTEIARVLKPGGAALILEFGQPYVPGFALLYRLYSRWVMPLIGGLITGNRAAYRYLPETASEFPCGSRFEEILRRCGLKPTICHPQTLGIAYLYIAQK